MSQPAWPSVEEQIAHSRVPAGSALEQLIRDNQDFHLLHPNEVRDTLGIPLWLRVHWRKHHPEHVYSPKDLTGGYPRALRNIHAWMVAHPDLKPGPPSHQAAAPRAAEEEALAGAGTNQRISGGQTTPRSETDIRVNYRDTRKIIAASNAIGANTQAQFYSPDGGATWGQTTLPLLAQDSFQSDPAVDWTSDGTAWAITIGIDAAGANLQMRAYKSVDGGQTWNFDATISGNETAADKEMMWVDHSAASTFKDTIYVIWHNNQPTVVNRRIGSTGAWQNPLQVSGAETTGTGIGSDIKTNAVGDVFAFWPDTGSQKLFVAKSTDGGANFAAPVAIAATFGSFQISVPSFADRQALIYLSGGAYRTPGKNLVYAAWVDLTGAAGCAVPNDAPGSNANSTCKSRIWFTRSPDGGATWEAPRMINNQASRNDQFHPRLVVDETNGQLVISYDDTVGDPGRLKTDVWFQSSSDDGLTWSAPAKVTTAQTDETGGGADLGNQYGDYAGLSGYAGKFFPSWTDRRAGLHEEIWTAPIDLGTPTVVVPDCSGQDRNTATNTITSSGLVVGKVRTHGPSRAKYTYVDSQSPDPGTVAPVGSAVDLDLIRTNRRPQ